MQIKCFDKVGKEYLVEEKDIVNTRRVYGVFVKDGQVLLVFDKRGEFWEIPGGGVQDSETDLEAIQREIKEETGLEISDQIKLIDSYTELYYSRGYQEAWMSSRNYYLIEVVGGKIQKAGNGLDTSGAKYFDLKDLDSLSMNLKQREVIKKAV
jgi:8-oxo-dGTP pyrophosphatase MutT (NUDIX family)